MSAAADFDHAIDVETAAQASFAFMVWSLGCMPPERRDFLMVLFATELPERIATLLDEGERKIEFMSIQ